MDENNNSEAVNNPSSSGIFFRLLSKRTFLLGVLIILILLVVFAVFSFFSIQKNNKITQARNDVYQKLKIGDYKGAQEAARKGLAIKKDDEYLIKNFINAVSSQGNKTGKEIDALKISEPYIKELLKGNNSADDLLTAGYAYETAGQYEKALTYYEDAISKNPKLSEAYFHKGHVLAFLNRESESQQAYDKAYELDPNNYLVSIVRARKLNIAKDYDGALVLLTRIGESIDMSNFQRAEAYTGAALVEFGRGNFNEAKQFAQKAVDVDSSYSAGLAFNGYFLAFNVNTYKSGIAKISKAIELNPRISLNYFLLGLIMRQYNYLDQAIALQKQGLSKIVNDNTLIGEEAIKTSRSRMYYELAHTYSKKSDISNTVYYLKLAFEENSVYKTKIKEDITSGLFDNVKINKSFTELVNSK